MCPEVSLTDPKTLIGFRESARGMVVEPRFICLLSAVRGLCAWPSVAVWSGRKTNLPRGYWV